MNTPPPGPDHSPTRDALCYKLSRLAAVYRITGEKKYLDGILRWRPLMDAMQAIEIDEDLNIGFFLAHFATFYDLLHGAVDEQTKGSIRRALIQQSRQTYADLSRREQFAFEQNHLIIPVCGLALAGYALMDELPEAGDWVVFSRNLLSRSLDALAHDGWFFEGISYWDFTIPFPLMYASATRRVLGEDLFQQPFFRIRIRTG